MENEALRAGTAMADITSREEGVKVHDPLLAKVLVIENHEKRIALIALDAVAIGLICDILDDFLDTLREKLRKELGIDEALVSATHTHMAGPMICDHISLVDKVFGAAKEACEKMKPVKIGWGKGYEDKFIINRTLRLKNARAWSIRQTNPCPPDCEVEGLGVADPEIGILRIDDMDGNPVSLVFNFACHPLLGVPDGALTGNYPGFASAVIQDNLHGAMALFLQGAGGDITEVTYKDVNTPASGRSNGIELGLSTLRAHSSIGTSQSNALAVYSKVIRLPRKRDFDERIGELLQEQEELLRSLRFTSLNFKSFLPLYIKHSIDPEHPADYSYRYIRESHINRHDLTDMDESNRRNIEKYLSNIYAMEKLARIQDKIATLQVHKEHNEGSGESTVQAEVMAIRIGNGVIISAPIELLCQIGLNLKAASPTENTMVAAYANGYLHYGPDKADYPQLGYEATECMLDEGWQQIYEETARELMHRAWNHRG